MKKPLHIVVLTPGFAADEQDTTSVPSLQLFTRALKANYHELGIHIVAFQHPVRPGKYSWHGIPAYSAGGKVKKLTRIITWMKVLAHLYRLNKKRPIDLVHAFWLTEATLIGWVFCRLLGIRFLATAMGQDVKPENKYLKFIRLFSFDMTIISSFQEKYINRLKKAMVLKVIPFGIDKTYFHQVTSKRETDVLGVGSLNRIKNYGEFIEIIETVAERHPGIRCKIIGDGSEREEIERIIKVKGLEKNITLTGNLSYDKAIEEMHRGKILLHTSTFEGQALVITEALAAGMQVSCHPVGIAASLESHHLFTSHSTEDLASNITSLLQDVQMDHNPEIHFTIDGTCREYYKIYHVKRETDH